MEPSSQRHSRDRISSRRRGVHLIGIFFATIFSSVVKTNAELGRPDSSNAIQRGPQPAYAASNTILYSGIESYRSSNRLRRGQSKEQYIWQRLLLRKKSGSSGGSVSDYNGCLSYSDEELKSKWKFQGNAPSCSYVHHSSGGGGGGSGGGSSNGGNSGSSSGSSGGGSSSSSSGSSSGGGGSGSSSGSSGGGSTSSTGSSGGGSSSSNSGDNGGNNNGSGGNNSGGNNNGNGNNVGGDGNGNDGNGGGNGNGNDQNNSGGNNNGNGNKNGSNGNGNDNDGNGSNNGGGNGNNRNNGGNNGGNGGDESNDQAENGYDDNYYAYDDEVVYNGDYNTDNDDGGNDNNPYYDFDITKCDTYENLWMWDLSLTCDDSESFENCECAFTEELLAYGYLTCYDKALCPSDCQICERCLQIVGCSQEITGGAGKHLVSTDNFSFFIIASAVGVLVVATVVYTRTRQDKKQDGLGAHLMEDDPNAGTHPMEVNWNSPTEFPDVLAPSQFSPAIITEVPIPLATIGELSFHEACAEEPGIVWLAPM